MKLIAASALEISTYNLPGGYWKMEPGNGPNDIDLPKVVPVKDQPCQQLYEGNPVLLGFDVVQYHFIPSVKDGGVAVRGNPDFAYNFNGYQFWFSSRENRQLFIDDPWRYAPAWGGFCSWGIALELPPSWPWDVDYLGPPASPWNGWLIVDGVLMFNIWESYSDRFSLNLERNIELAANRWANYFGDGKHRFGGPFNTHCIGHGKLQNWCLSKQPSPWMEELPTCLIDINNVTFAGDDPESVLASTTNPQNTTSVVPPTTSTTVSGGGVVSDANEFSDFSNSRYSPHQQKMFKVGASVIFVSLIAILAAYCFRKDIKKACSQCFGRTPGPACNPSSACNTEKDVDRSDDTEVTDSAKLEEGTIVYETENEDGKIVSGSV
mmetsp:Transcript_18757/g.40834  ORF Transcript_18757/g.40834 Transcript_18757/m.40834 type:complete len:379 (-) Transcript_18757:4639-5775(-)